MYPAPINPQGPGIPAPAPGQDIPLGLQGLPDPKPLTQYSAKLHHQINVRRQYNNLQDYSDPSKKNPYQQSLSIVNREVDSEYQKVKPIIDEQVINPLLAGEWIDKLTLRDQAGFRRPNHGAIQAEVDKRVKALGGSDEVVQATTAFLKAQIGAVDIKDKWESKLSRDIKAAQDAGMINRVGDTEEFKKQLVRAGAILPSAEKQIKERMQIRYDKSLAPIKERYAAVAAEINAKYDAKLREVADLAADDELVNTQFEIDQFAAEQQALVDQGMKDPALAQKNVELKSQELYKAYNQRVSSKEFRDKVSAAFSEQYGSMLHEELRPIQERVAAESRAVWSETVNRSKREYAEVQDMVKGLFAELERIGGQLDDSSKKMIDEMAKVAWDEADAEYRAEQDAAVNNVHSTLASSYLPVAVGAKAAESFSTLWKSFKSNTGTGIMGVVGALNSAGFDSPFLRGLAAAGGELQVENSMPIPEDLEWWHFLSPTFMAQQAGQLAFAVPSIVAAGAVAPFTAGTSIPAAVGGLVGVMYAGATNAGDVREQILQKRPWDVAGANEAAKKMFLANFATLPLEMTIAKFWTTATRAGGAGARQLIGQGVAEYGTESYEAAVSKTLVDGGSFTQNWLDRNVQKEGLLAAYGAIIPGAPATLVGRVRGSLSTIVDTDTQFIAGRIYDQGKDRAHADFLDAEIEISPAFAEQAAAKVDRIAGFIDDAKAAGMNRQQSLLYAQLNERLIQEKERVAKISNPVLRKAHEARVASLEQKIAGLVEAPPAVRQITVGTTTFVAEEADAKKIEAMPAIQEAAAQGVVSIPGMEVKTLPQAVVSPDAQQVVAAVVENAPAINVDNPVGAQVRQLVDSGADEQSIVDATVNEVSALGFDRAEAVFGKDIVMAVRKFTARKLRESMLQPAEAAPAQVETVATEEVAPVAQTKAPVIQMQSPVAEATQQPAPEIVQADMPQTEADVQDRAARKNYLARVEQDITTYRSLSPEGKMKKLDGMYTRLNEAKNAGIITREEFDDQYDAIAGMRQALVDSNPALRAKAKEAQGAGRGATPQGRVGASPSVAPATGSDSRVANLQQSLQSAGIRVDVFESTEEFDNEVEAAGGRRGVEGIFDAGGGRILLNAEKINNPDFGDRIVFHEGAHPVLNIIRNTNRPLYDQVIRGLREAARLGDPAASEALRWAEENYSGDATVDDEFATESVAMVGDGTLNLDALPRSTAQAIIDFVNKIAEILGFDKVIGDLQSTKDMQAFRDLASRVADALRSGTDIAEIVGEENIAQTQGPSAQERAVSVAKGAESMRQYGLDPGKRANVRKIGEALEARTRKKFGTIGRNDRSKEALAKVSSWMAEEFKYFVEEFGENSGLGWYGEKFQKGLDAMASVFPEMATDQNARDLFTMLVAVTSDGAKVKYNFKLATVAYQAMKDGTIEQASFGGQRMKSYRRNIDQIVKLVKDNGGDVQAVKNMLLKKVRMSDVNAAARKAGEKTKSDWPADFVVPYAASVFGPKLGMFYANLSGMEEYPTLDRWWSRTFNRYRGTLIPAVKKGEVNGKKIGIDAYREVAGLDGATEEEVIAAIVRDHESYKAKGFKDGTDAEKKANTIHKAMFTELEDAPFGSGDRQFMYDAFVETRKKLKRSGINATIADIQAVLWYFEKNLYKKLGSASDVTGISYEEAATSVAQDFLKNGEVVFTKDDNKDSDVDEGLEAFDEEPGVQASAGNRQLLAPNGKPSNLTPAQYAQVRTPEFKAWFGDWENDPANASKVVDNNGEPKVMYHGTAVHNGIKSFSGWRGSAGHFAFDERFAKEFAEDKAASENEIGDEYQGFAQIIPVFINARSIFDPRDDEDAELDWSWAEENIDKIYGEGYDAYLDFEGGGALPSGIAVKSPTQIKSATANTGSFDATNPDIRYSIGNRRSIDAIANAARLVYKNAGYHGGTLAAKSDYLSSGYYGDMPFTGYYFFGDPERAISRGDRRAIANNEFRIVDFSKYKLIRPTTNSYWLLKSNLKRLVSHLMDGRSVDDFLSDKKYGELGGYEVAKSIQAAAKQIESEFPAWNSIELKGYPVNNKKERFETIILKLAGWDGIDVRGLKEEDGTASPDTASEGSVIFDLKPGTVTTLADAYQSAVDSGSNPDLVAAFDNIEKESSVQSSVGNRRARSVANRIRSAKVKNDRLYDAILGLPVAIYNGMLETVATMIEAGATVADAVTSGIEYIKANMQGEKFTDKEIRDAVEQDLERLGIKPEPRKDSQTRTDIKEEFDGFKGEGGKRASTPGGKMSFRELFRRRFQAEKRTVAAIREMQDEVMKYFRENGIDMTRSRVSKVLKALASAADIAALDDAAAGTTEMLADIFEEIDKVIAEQEFSNEIKEANEVMKKFAKFRKKSKHLDAKYKSKMADILMMSPTKIVMALRAAMEFATLPALFSASTLLSQQSQDVRGTLRQFIDALNLIMQEYGGKQGVRELTMENLDYMIGEMNKLAGIIADYELARDQQKYEAAKVSGETAAKSYEEWVDERQSRKDLASMDRKIDASATAGKQIDQLNELVRVQKDRISDWLTELENMYIDDKSNPIFVALKRIAEEFRDLDTGMMDKDALVEFNAMLNNLLLDSNVMNADRFLSYWKDTRAKMAELKSKPIRIRGVLNKNMHSLSALLTALTFNKDDAARMREWLTPFSASANKVWRMLHGYMDTKNSIISDIQKLVNRFGEGQYVMGVNKVGVFQFLNQAEEIPGEGNKPGLTKDEDFTRRARVLMDGAINRYNNAAGSERVSREARTEMKAAKDTLDALSALNLITGYSVQNGVISAELSPVATLQTAEASMSSAENDLYNYIRDKFADQEYLAKMKMVSESLYGVPFNGRANYAPQMPIRIAGRDTAPDAAKTIENIGNGDPAGVGYGRVGVKPSDRFHQRGSLADPKLFAYSTDAVSNFISAFYESNFAIEAGRQMKALSYTLNSTDFADFINGIYNAKFKDGVFDPDYDGPRAEFRFLHGTRNKSQYTAILSRLADVMQDAAYPPYLRKDSRGTTQQIFDYVVGDITSTILNTSDQVVKQVVPNLVSGMQYSGVKATMAAIRIMTLAMHNSQQMQAMREFMRNFEADLRSSRGEEIFDEVEKILQNQKKWYRVVTKWTDFKDKTMPLPSAIGKMIFQKGDRFAYMVNALAAYIDAEVESGRLSSAEDFDMENVVVNTQSVYKALNVTEALNNASKAGERAPWTRQRKVDPNSNALERILRNMMFLKGFSLNSAMHAWANASLGFNPIKRSYTYQLSTQEERAEARSRFMAYAWQVGIFNAMKVAILTPMYTGAGKFLVEDVFGMALAEESEEEKRKRRQKMMMQVAMQSLSDGLVGWTPGPIEASSKYVFNFLYDLAADAAAGGEENRRLPINKDTLLDSRYKPFYEGGDTGVGTVDLVVDLGKTFREAWNTRSGRQYTPAGNEALDYMDVAKAFTFLLGQGDILKLEYGMEKAIKIGAKSKRSESVSSGSGGGKLPSLKPTMNRLSSPGLK